MKKYYMLEQDGTAASVTIYGDITSWPWEESDVSAYLLSKQIDGIDADLIDVYINSYGGEVSEGLAIYNALRRHKAKVVTHCDGFACSVASVVFMAGDERLMSDASLLMIHNAWNYACGNAAELRKAADDLDVISDAAANAYRACVNIGDDKLKALLDGGTWIAPKDAVDMGFATAIQQDSHSGTPTASARSHIMECLLQPKSGAPASIDVGDLASKLAEEMKTRMQQNPPRDNKFMSALMRGRRL